MHLLRFVVLLGGVTSMLGRMKRRFGAGNFQMRKRDSVIKMPGQTGQPQIARMVAQFGKGLDQPGVRHERRGSFLTRPDGSERVYPAWAYKTIYASTEKRRTARSRAALSSLRSGVA